MEATLRTSKRKSKNKKSNHFETIWYSIIFLFDLYVYILFLSLLLSILSITQKFTHLKALKNQNQAIYKSVKNISKFMKKITKVTSIPIKIINNPKQSAGLIRFSTEAASKVSVNRESQLSTKKRIISLKTEGQQCDEDEIKPKRQINYYEALISSSRFKNKKFRVQLPIAAHRYKQRPSQNIHFTFSFSNYQGNITILDGLFDAKTQTVKSDQCEKTYKERLQLQLACLDNRRKQEINIKK